MVAIWLVAADMKNKTHKLLAHCASSSNDLFFDVRRNVTI